MILSDWLNYLSLVQLAVALDFGFVVFSEGTWFTTLQKDVYEWARNNWLVNRLIEWSMSVFIPMDDCDDERIRRRYAKLEGLCGKFWAVMNWEKSGSHFISIGYVSGLASIGYLGYVPSMKLMPEDLSVNIYASASLAFLIIDVILFYLSCRSILPKRAAALTLSTVFMGIAAMVIAVCQWTNSGMPIWMGVDTMFLLSLCIPFMPIIFYALQLLFCVAVRGWVLAQIVWHTLVMKLLRWWLS